MENDVRAAKLADDKNPCVIQDVMYAEDVTQYWTIDDAGDPVDLNDSTGGDFRSYTCMGCYSQFDTFEEAKEHLDES